MELFYPKMLLTTCGIFFDNKYLEHQCNWSRSKLHENIWHNSKDDLEISTLQILVSNICSSIKHYHVKKVPYKMMLLYSNKAQLQIS